MVARVAVSLDDALLDAVEKQREKTRESRSAFLCRALRTLLREEKERASVACYVTAHRENPEGKKEVIAARASARRAVRRLEWDDS